MYPFHEERQYLSLMERIFDEGDRRPDRTGTGTLSVFGAQLQFNLVDGFPLLTTKRLHWRSIAAEILWMLRGETNIEPLNRDGVTIWDEWADEDGDLGPVYGHQWRRWRMDRVGKTVDQMQVLIDSIKSSPFSRRHVVSAWNVTDLPHMALPPCHTMFQCWVGNEGGISLHMYQRSADVFLGLPFNIAGYALLLHLIGAHTGFHPHRLIISIGDAHLYENHLDQAALQLQREPRPWPKLVFLDKAVGISDWHLHDFRIEGYNPHPHIAAAVSV